MNYAIRNVSSFIVLQGYIVNLGQKQTRINSPRAGIYDVKWKNGQLPTGVNLGSYVTIIGQLITLDLGRAFLVVKAEALKPRAMVRIKKFIESEREASK